MGHPTWQPYLLGSSKAHASNFPFQRSCGDKVSQIWRGQLLGTKRCIELPSGHHCRRWLWFLFLLSMCKYFQQSCAKKTPANPSTVDTQQTNQPMSTVFASAQVNLLRKKNLTSFSQSLSLLGNGWRLKSAAKTANWTWGALVILSRLRALQSSLVRDKVLSKKGTKHAVRVTEVRL